MKLPLFSALILTSIAGIIILLSQANAAIPYNYNAGIVTGSNTSISKTITMAQEREIVFILKNTGGNFNNQLLNVSISADATTYYKIDSVSTGTGNTKVLQYSDTNKGATLAVNPALFPFIKVEFPQVLNKNIVLTWSSVRG